MTSTMSSGMESILRRNRGRILRWRAFVAVCLGAWLLWAPMAVGDERADLRARRVEAIKTCTHGPDEPCPHGRVWYVDARAPGASDENDKTAQAPLKTINRAGQVALPGDTVLVGNGVYREHVSPAHSGYDVAHMISYVARNRHRAVIKGSDVWRPKWCRVELEGVAGPVWQAELSGDLFTYDFPVENYNPFIMSNAMHRGPDGFYAPNRPSASDAFPPTVRGMIFADRRRLVQARCLTDFAAATDVFFVAADGGSVYARFKDNNPAAHFYEIATREQVFAPKTTGVAFIRVKGFVMEHGANRPAHLQYGMVSPSSSNGGGWHWIIEDNVIRWAGACGLDIGVGYWGPGRRTTRSSIDEEIGATPSWRHWIKGNAITDNGHAGIWSIGGSTNAIIEYNRFERNCWQNTIHMVEAASLKMHGCSGVVIRGNLVRDNDNFGLWIDVAGPNNRITQNLLLNNMTAGVFIEGMWGHTMVDNNIAAFTRAFAFKQMNMGDGFYNHQASHVTFAHNLALGNTGYGFRCLMWGLQGANAFPDGRVRVSHNRVLNNIAYANGRGAVCLPLDQKHCKDNRSDHNFIWGASGLPLFELGRAILPPSVMMATVEAAMKKAGVGPDQVPFLTQWKSGEMGPNVGDIRHYGPVVSLPVWRAAAGRDFHSVVGPLPIFWLTRAGQMQVNLNIPDRPVGDSPGDGPEAVGAKPENYRRLDEVNCVRIPEIVCDYFGNPRPADAAPTVGPFQDLKQLGQGEKEPVFLHLWPLDPSRQLPAESLRLDRPMPELDEQETAAGKNYFE